MFLFGHTHILYNQIEAYLIYPIPDNNVQNARIIHYFLHSYIQNVSYWIVLIDVILNLFLITTLFLYYYAIDAIESCIYIWGDTYSTVYSLYVFLYGLFIYFIYSYIQSICRW